MTRTARAAFTLIELLVVLAVIGVLVGLMLGAVQKVRAAAGRTACQNQMKQLALALHQHQDARGALPAGYTPLKIEPKPGRLNATGWTIPVLPYLEQSALHGEVVGPFGATLIPFADPPHVHRKTVVRAFTCPSDGRTRLAQVEPNESKPVALLSYQGVSGVETGDGLGMLHGDSRLRLQDAADGTSSTLLLGERPPSHDFRFGWWHSGMGQAGDGSADLILGVKEKNSTPIVSGSWCGPGNYPYMEASGYFDPCGFLHYWGPHNGANFALADGSVRLIPYGAADAMPALATRAAGDSVPAGAMP